MNPTNERPAATLREAFYVTVRNDSQTGLLLGPYDHLAEALNNVDRAQEAAGELDPWAHFYSYGTVRIVAGKLPDGRLNKRIGLWPCNPKAREAADRL